MEPYFFSSRSYSEPESVAKSILTNKKSEITNGPALKMQVAAGDVFNVIPDLQLFVAELVNRHFTSFCCPQSRSMHVHAPLTFLFFLSTNIVWFILGLNCLGQNCAYCFF